MKNLLILFILAAVCACSTASSTIGQPTATDEVARRPRLVVGVVVDQMKPEFIERYWSEFGAGGFKRLVGEGFTAANLHYNYMPTYTGPGHAAVYTGTSPAYNGIVANDWFVRADGSVRYCARDTSVKGLGSASPAARMSPVHLTASTLGDELRVFSSMRSKVIGVAMKDRGAILPAGRMANAAYWYIGGAEDTWASSSWYEMESLPAWVQEFNGERRGEEYLSRGWSLLLGEEHYAASMDDNNPYESPFRGKLQPVFPYDLQALRADNNQYDLMKSTPWGNTLTVDFAMAAVRGEQLGKRGVTDMLCLSFSSTDYIGHQFGIHSREIQDCYLRLDRDLAALLTFLDSEIGRGEYLLFLTADHGGAPTPSYTAKHGSPASYFRSQMLEDQVESYLDKKYGEALWVVNESNQNIFLSLDAISARDLELQAVEEEVARFILSIPGVHESFTGSLLRGQGTLSPIGGRVQLGYHQRLSGDVIYTLQPGWIEYGMMGTTHGSPYAYDTHVPALFYGFGVKSGRTWRPYTICDLAPTVAAICRIPLPNACIGQPITELIR